MLVLRKNIRAFNSLRNNHNLCFVASMCTCTLWFTHADVFCAYQNSWNTAQNWLKCFFFFNFFFRKSRSYWLIDWLLCWVFVSVRGLSLVAASGGHSSSLCAGLSPSRPLLPQSTGSRRAGSAICGSWAQLLRGMWDLPRPGLEPVSPALVGRFSTTAPPGKPSNAFLKDWSRVDLQFCVSFRCTER